MRRWAARCWRVRTTLTSTRPSGPEAVVYDSQSPLGLPARGPQRSLRRVPGFRLRRPQRLQRRAGPDDRRAAGAVHDERPPGPAVLGGDGAAGCSTGPSLDDAGRIRQAYLAAYGRPADRRRRSPAPWTISRRFECGPAKPRRGRRREIVASGPGRGSARRSSRRVSSFISTDRLRSGARGGDGGIAMNSALECDRGPSDVAARAAPAAAAAVSRSLALAGLLAEESRAGEPDLREPAGAAAAAFPARAKRVIFLFMHGGPSQVDTFDHKPLLERDHGKPLPFAEAARAFEPDRQPAALAVPVPAARGERDRRQRAVPPPGPSCRRPLRHQLDARLQLAARRGPAGASHRQRHLRPAEHGVLDHLRPRDREPGPARLHHDLPEPRAMAASTTGARRSCRPSTRGRRSATRAFPPIGRRSRSSSNTATPRPPATARARPGPGDEPRPPRQAGPTRPSKAGSPRSSWPSGCRRPRPSPGHLRRVAGDASSSTGSTTRATRDFGRQCLMARRFAERGVRFVQVSHSLQVGPARRPQEGYRPQRPGSRPADRRPAHAT